MKFVRSSVHRRHGKLLPTFGSLKVVTVSRTTSFGLTTSRNKKTIRFATLTILADCQTNTYFQELYFLTKRDMNTYPPEIAEILGTQLHATAMIRCDSDFLDFILTSPSRSGLRYASTPNAYACAIDRKNI